jgi:hypothetical protein
MVICKAHDFLRNEAYTVRRSDEGILGARRSWGIATLRSQQAPQMAVSSQPLRKRKLSCQE